MTSPRKAWADAQPAASHPSWQQGEEAFYSSGVEQAAVIHRAWQRYGQPGVGKPRVLDFGAGPGRLAIHIAPWAGIVVAEDVNLNYRKLARRAANSRGLVNVEVGEETDSRRFDLAVAVGVLPSYPPHAGAELLANLALRAPLVVVSIPLYNRQRTGNSWADETVWTKGMLDVAAGAVGFDLLEAPDNGIDPGLPPGPNHDALSVIRRKNLRPRTCCGGDRE